MAVSEKQKEYCKRYQRTLAQFSIKLKPEALVKYKQAAEKAGTPFRAWVLAAMDEKMKM